MKSRIVSLLIVVCLVLPSVNATWAAAVSRQEAGPPAQPQARQYPPIVFDQSATQDQTKTPIQRALQTTFEERRAYRLPVPSQVSYENHVSASPDSSGAVAGKTGRRPQISGKTILHFDNPSQAGYKKWPSLVVKDSLPDRAKGFVSPGDYTQAMREWREQKEPGIWKRYEFGYEPRTYIITETFEITYPGEKAQVLGLAPTSISDSTTVEQILLGFTYLGPNLNYTIEVGCEDLGTYAKAGFELDWAFGLRLPVEVSLTAPDSMTIGSTYSLSSSITPLDWSEADYEQAGVAAEGGNESVLRFKFFLGAKAEILWIPVLDWALDVDFDKSQSFTTPFGPGVEFPITEFDLSPHLTGLEWGFDNILSLGIGLVLKPYLGSDKITADWQAVPGGDASGNGFLRYSSPRTPVIFGPVIACDLGPTNYAHIRLSEFRYWFTRFLIELDGYIALDLFGFEAKTEPFEIADFDPSSLTNDLSIGIHVGTNGDLDHNVLVVDHNPLRVSPASLLFLALYNGNVPPTGNIRVSSNCGPARWQVNSDATWLQPQSSGDSIRVSMNQSGLITGTYGGTLAISAVDVSNVSPILVPVRLVVADRIFEVYLPFVMR